MEHDLVAEAEAVGPGPSSPSTCHRSERWTDEGALAKRFDVLHRTFLGYPRTLAPPSRTKRFLGLYRDIVRMHKTEARSRASRLTRRAGRRSATGSYATPSFTFTDMEGSKMATRRTFLKVLGAAQQPQAWRFRRSRPSRTLPRRTTESSSSSSTPREGGTSLSGPTPERAPRARSPRVDREHRHFAAPAVARRSARRDREDVRARSAPGLLSRVRAGCRRACRHRRSDHDCERARHEHGRAPRRRHVLCDGEAPSGRARPVAQHRHDDRQRASEESSSFRAFRSVFRQRTWGRTSTDAWSLSPSET